MDDLRVLGEIERVIRQLWHRVGRSVARLVSIRGLRENEFRVHPGRVSRGDRSNRERLKPVADPRGLIIAIRSYFNDRGYRANNRRRRSRHEIEAGNNWISYREREHMRRLDGMG